MSRRIKDEAVGTEEISGTVDLLGRVGAFRTEAFDLLDVLTRRSTRTLGSSALPEATAEMQCLVNGLGDLERLLSQGPERAARPRLTLPERR
jgi:hypothetical protein